MSTLIEAVRVRRAPDIMELSELPTRLLVGIGIAGLLGLAMIADPTLRPVVTGALADAYLQVTVFVAGTLGLLLAAERYFKIDTIAALERGGIWQVPLAALLGALPGCGGAIVVATQYASGRIGFGALLATLTATMGDAAFLLLAQEPLTGLGIFALGFGVGTATGWFADAVHGRDFMRQARATKRVQPVRGATALDGIARRLDRPWLALMVPGAVLGVLAAFQVDTDALIGLGGVTETIGVAGAVLAVGMWLMGRGHEEGAYGTEGAACQGSARAHLIDDTNFVTAWVIAAFLIYEVGVHGLGIDLGLLFEAALPALPLIAVLAGFLPGCGPAIVVTSLYLGGLIPTSALIGNAISNDGDALFPTMAIAPKAAIVATLYSAVPALILAYGYMAIWE